MSKAVQFFKDEMESRSKRLSGKRADLNTVREHNRSLILNYIREHGPISRAALAQHMELSRATVGMIIDELEQAEVVHEGDKLNAAQKGGRRATYIHFSANAGYIIGVDIGRSHLTLLLTDLEAKPVTEWSGPLNINDGAKVCLTHVADQLCALLETSSATWERVIGIGLALPGPLDPQLRRVLQAPQMPGWEKIDVRTFLGRRLKKKIPIYMDNDANMGALGESRYGAGRGVADLAYVKIGTGIGAGLIINGCLYHGSGSAAGELGHMVVDENGAKCVCGNRGCLETVAAAAAIVKDACEGVSLRIRRPQSTQTSALAGRIDEVDIEEVIQAAQNGDEASCAALERAGERIGIALGSLINLFNPSKILLDGSVVRKNELLLSFLGRSAEASSLYANWVGTGVEIGLLDNKAVALGAVGNVIDFIFGVPSKNLIVEKQER